MCTRFKEGDVLLYFNKDVIHIVILDIIEDEYFIVVVDEEGDYFYGRKIKKKNLSEKYFIKLDYLGNVKSPHPWLTF